MALLFMDSFDHYVTADILLKWTASEFGFFGTNAINTTGGRRGSGSFRFSDSNNNVNAFGCLRKSLTPGDATGIAGFAVSIPTTEINPTNGTPLLVFRDVTTPQVTLRINQNRTISVCRGAHSGTVLGTSTLTVPAVFSYLELKVKIDPAVGTVDVKIDNVTALSLTAQNTRNSASSVWNNVVLGIGGDAVAGVGGVIIPIDFDDFYVMDGTGAAPWNNFLGDVRVDPRVPTAAGATTGWTPSAGSNWQNVDDAQPNGDTDFNSAAAAAVTDTFVVQDAPVVGATVFGVQHCINMRKTDAGACTIAPVVRHSGADNVGADISPTTAYNYAIVMNQVNPGTAAQWTEANFNAAEFGYRRTT